MDGASSVFWSIIAGIMAHINAERAWEAMASVILAATGGIARVLSQKKTEKLTLQVVFREIFVAGFTGYLVLSLCRTQNIAGDWVTLFCGVAGWTAPIFVVIITDKVFSMVESADQTKSTAQDVNKK